MIQSKFIAWVSLFFAAIGIILFLRRVILWRLRKAQIEREKAAMPPTPVELTPDHRILVLSNGEQFGPYTRGELVTLARSGKVPEDAMCWEPGQEDWIPVKVLAEM